MPNVPQTISLAATSGATVSSSANCVASWNTVIIGANDSDATFYVRANPANGTTPIDVLATDVDGQNNGLYLQANTFRINVITPPGPQWPPNGISFSVAGGNDRQVDSCVLLTMQLTYNGIPAVPPLGTPSQLFQVSQNPGPTQPYPDVFYDSNGCANDSVLAGSNPDIVIPSGQSGRSFSWRPFKAPRNVTITTSFSGMNANQTLSIRPTLPSFIAITPEVSDQRAGSCVGFSVAYLDAFRNPSGFPGMPQIVQLNGLPVQSLFSDGPTVTSGGCLNAIDNATVQINPPPTGSYASSATYFYVKIRAAMPSPSYYTLTPVSGTVTAIAAKISVRPADADLLVIESNGAASAFAGTCIDFTVRMSDNFGNTLNSIAAPKTVLFREDQSSGLMHKGWGCSGTSSPGGISDVMSGATTSLKFSYVDNVAHDVTFTASAPLITYGHYPTPPPFQILAADPREFAAVVPGASPRAGVCSGASLANGGSNDGTALAGGIDFKMLDQFGNTTTFRSPAYVGLVAMNFRDFPLDANVSRKLPRLYLDANCTQEIVAPISAFNHVKHLRYVDLRQIKDGGKFWFKHEVAEHFDLQFVALTPPASGSTSIPTAPYLNPYRPSINTYLVGLNVTAGIPTTLKFDGMPATLQVTAGSCSAPIKFGLFDAFGNPSSWPNNAGSLTVTLGATNYPSGSAPKFFLGSGNGNNGCAVNGNPQLTSLVMMPGTQNATFFMEQTVASNFQITASATIQGVQQLDSQPVSVSGATAVVLSWNPDGGTSIAGLSGSGVIGFCGPGNAGYRITSRDALGGYGPGNPSNVQSDTVVSLRARDARTKGIATDVKFYADMNCTTLLPVVDGYARIVIAAGNSQSPAFWVAGTKARYNELLAFSDRLVGQRVTHIIDPGEPFTIGFILAPAVSQSVCSAAQQVVIYDRYQNETPVIKSEPGAPLSVNFGLTVPTQPAMPPSPFDIQARFFIDPTCTTMIPSMPLAQNQTRLAVYFKSFAQGVHTLRATYQPGPTTLLTSGEANLTVTPGNLSTNSLRVFNLANSNAPLFYNSTIALNTCTLFEARVYGPTGVVVNPFLGQGTMTLTATGASFYNALYPATDTNCAGPSSAVITKTFEPDSDGFFRFRVKPTASGALNLVASMPIGGVVIGSYHFINAQATCTPNESAPVRFCFPSAVWTQWISSCHNSDSLRATWPGNFNASGQFSGGFVYVKIRTSCDANGRQFQEYVAVGRFDDGCFPPETRLAMAGGLPKRADLIRTGDELWNPVLHKPMFVKNVVKGPEPTPLLKFTAGGKSLTVSTKHPMVTKRGLLAAHLVEVGDELIAHDGKAQRVSQIVSLPLKKGQMVYNFEVVTESNDPKERMISAEGFVTGEWTLQSALQKAERRSTP